MFDWENHGKTIGKTRGKTLGKWRFMVYPLVDIQKKTMEKSILLNGNTDELSMAMAPIANCLSSPEGSLEISGEESEYAFLEVIPSNMAAAMNQELSDH